jgi:hypothetical protein
LPSSPVVCHRQPSPHAGENRQKTGKLMTLTLQNDP